MKKIEITVQSKIENAAVVSDKVRSFLESGRFTSESINDVLVCVDEAFSNIVFHGYKNKEDGEVSLALEINAKTCKLVFVDFADKFTPGIKKPTLGKELLERTNLGLGIYLMQELMDTVTYERVNDANRLTLIKKLM